MAFLVTKRSYKLFFGPTSSRLLSLDTITPVSLENKRSETLLQQKKKKNTGNDEVIFTGGVLDALGHCKSVSSWISVTLVLINQSQTKIRTGSTDGYRSGS